MAISMLKIRRPLGRLIFNMGIAIPGKTVFFIETAPSSSEFQKRICETRHMGESLRWGTTQLGLLRALQRAIEVIYLSKFVTIVKIAGVSKINFQS